MEAKHMKAIPILSIAVLVLVAALISFVVLSDSNAYGADSNDNNPLKASSTLGYVSISKVDDDLNAFKNQGNAKLVGAEYGVYSDMACTNQVATIVIDENGKGRTPGNTLSTSQEWYYVKETKAPVGYNLDTHVYRVKPSVDENEPGGGNVEPIDDGYLRGQEVVDAYNAVGNGPKGTLGTCWWWVDNSVSTYTLHLAPMNGAESGTLAAIEHYDFGSKAPWISDRYNLGAVVVEPGVIANEDSSDLFSWLKFATKFDVNNLDVSNAKDLSYMFARCRAQNLDLHNWDTANVTNMTFMFDRCSHLSEINLEGVDTSSVTNMSGVFAFCTSLKNLDLSSFDTSNVTNMVSMFDYCASLKSLDLSSFNTENVTNMAGMFTYCTSLKTIYVSDAWTTNKVSNSTSMFYRADKIVGGSGTAYTTVVNKQYARVDNPPDAPGYFTYKAHA